MVKAIRLVTERTKNGIGSLDSGRIADLLLRNGANIAAVDSEGQTAYKLAYSKGFSMKNANKLSH